MADIRWNDAAMEAVLFEASMKAVTIVSERIAEDAKPLTHTLRTRPPGKREWYYSLPAGRLRRSIEAETTVETDGPVAYVNAAVPLGRFQGLGGGNAAYGGSRSHTPSLLIATEMQQGRSVP